ncbi:hypothetical protein ACFLY0_00200 [Patescibacteria group bacterium]
MSQVPKEISCALTILLSAIRVREDGLVLSYKKHRLLRVFTLEAVELEDLSLDYVKILIGKFLIDLGINSLNQHLDSLNSARTIYPDHTEHNAALAYLLKTDQLVPEKRQKIVYGSDTESGFIRSNCPHDDFPQLILDQILNEPKKPKKPGILDGVDLGPPPCGCC